MKKALAHVRSRALLYGGIAVVLIAAWALFSDKNGVEEELMTVERGSFVQEVSTSGKVIASQEVDLSFPETGRVASITVEVGDKVQTGQVLASLAMGTLVADLQAAEAQVALRRAETQNTSTNLEEVRGEQDTLVASAHRDLLSEGLAAVPNSSSYTVDPPDITGLYDGPEGTYRIRVERDDVNRNDYELRTFGLETTAVITILDDEPTPLGTRGLFISFPDDLSGYADTIWEVDVPNTKSSSYLANYNAYQEALRTRTRAIAAAEADLAQQNSGSTVAQARLKQAEAEVSRIQALIAERTLRAPFSGVVTVVDAEVGSVASANAPAISLIGTGSYQVESFVPEVNIALIEVGDIARVTLDAYGDDTIFEARVVSIDPAETIRDGVSTYRALLEFSEIDPRIKSGMTANVVITTDVRESVISIPQGIVSDTDGKKYVRVKEGEETIEREITTGAVSSLGSVEVLSGLREGDIVVLSSN